MLRRERVRMSERLEATVAALCELRILRERQDRLVHRELTAARGPEPETSESSPGSSPGGSRGGPGDTERPLGEALELLRDQLSRPLGATTSDPPSSQKEATTGTAPSEEVHETRRGRHAALELRDVTGPRADGGGSGGEGGGGHERQKSAGVLGALFGCATARPDVDRAVAGGDLSCTTSTAVRRSLRRRDASLYLQLKSLGDRLGEMGLGGPAQALDRRREEAMFEQLGEERPGRVTQAPPRLPGGAEKRSSRRRPSSGFSEWSGGPDRRVGSESDESEGSDEHVTTPGSWGHSDPASPVSPGTRRFARDVPSLDGSGLYRYPSALHAVAIQSPALLLLRDGDAPPGDPTESGEPRGAGALDTSGTPPTPRASADSGAAGALRASGASGGSGTSGKSGKSGQSGMTSGISSRSSTSGEAGTSSGTSSGGACTTEESAVPAATSTDGGAAPRSPPFAERFPSAGKPDDYIARLLERRKWRQAAAAKAPALASSKAAAASFSSSLSSSSSSSGRGSSVPSLPAAANAAAGEESETSVRLSLRSPPPPPPFLLPPFLPTASPLPSSSLSSGSKASLPHPPPAPAAPPPPSPPPSPSPPPGRRATRLVASVPPMKHGIVRGVSQFLTGGRLHAGKRAANKQQQQPQQQRQPPPPSKAAVRRCKSASLDRVAEWRPPPPIESAPFKRATTFGAPGRNRDDGGGGFGSGTGRPLVSASSRSIWDFFAAERGKMAAAAAASAECADYAAPLSVRRLCRAGDAGGDWAPLVGGSCGSCCCCCEEVTSCGCPGSCDGDNDDDNDDGGGDDDGGGGGGFASADRCYPSAAGFHDNRFGSGGPLQGNAGFRGDGFCFNDGGGGNGFRGNSFHGNGFRGDGFHTDGFHADGFHADGFPRSGFQGHSFHGVAKLPRGSNGLRGNPMHAGSAGCLRDGFLGDGYRGDAWRRGDARPQQGKASTGFGPGWGRPGAGGAGPQAGGGWWGAGPGGLGVAGGRSNGPGPQVSVAHVVPVGPAGLDGPAARRRALLRCHSVEPALTTTV
ncbi:unnamed protein product [Lampetra planeri]